MNCQEELVERLELNPKDPTIPLLIKDIEASANVDLSNDIALLRGVWELRWSSSTQPWLKQARWLENLQILDPVQQKGLNVLRLTGPLGFLAGIAVEAELSVNGLNQVGVKFKKGGWLGPTLGNGWRPTLLTAINQTFPAWLDITALNDSMRICRGNAGTCFVLLKRKNMSVEDWIR
jgi:hypothetical protein